MSDAGDLPKFPHAQVANDVGLRAGPGDLERKTSALAVASLALGVIGGVLLSVIFGAIALGRTGPSGMRGRWMAVTGLVVSGVWLVGLAIAVVANQQTDAERDAAGDIVESGDISTGKLNVGDCLAEIPTDGPVFSVPVVPCADPHQGEVIGTFELSADEFPDQAQLNTVVSRECPVFLRDYSPSVFDDPGVGIIYLAPAEKTWPDYKGVVCIADQFGEEMIGSLSDLRDGSP